MSLATGVLLILVFVTIEAFFSGSEIAMVNADRVRLQAAAERGEQGAAKALALLSDEPTLLATCLIGTNFCTVSGSTVAATLILTRGLGDAELATLLFTPITLVLGEALPKTVMQHHADRVAPWIAWPLTAARTAFRPFLAVVRAWNVVLLRVIGKPAGEGQLTRQELLDLLEEEQPGPIHPEERRLIRGVLSLQELTVAECMTPLIRVVAVAEDATVGVAADIAVRTQHSRLPVYSRRIDHIVGVVHQADLLFLVEDGAPLREHVRPASFVPDAKRADALFAEMRSEGEHFAVVVDEYGGCVGIVTLEDLLEELVGDIEDERDVVRPTIIELDDGSWVMPGNLELDELLRRTGVELPEGDYETVAGFVLAQLGRIPATGEEVMVGTARLRVDEATDRAVRRVRLELGPDGEGTSSPT
ncbi:MAG: HlyC/CorC family transporter [Alphaproteobacteria bacterium]|nr:HlyC/CorC family transporter [Alphaproteobacteria bacterium]